MDVEKTFESFLYNFPMLKSNKQQRQQQRQQWQQTIYIKRDNYDYLVNE